MAHVKLPATSGPRPTWWVQLLLVVGFAAGYDKVRALHGDIAAAAFAHGRDVLRLDRTWHMSWAEPMNRWLTEHQGLAHVLSSYYFVMHLGMTALVLLLLWLRSESYRRQGNVLVVTSLVGLAIYWAYPVAPPRMLAGFHDTVRQLLPAAYHLETAKANLYAAVPSLHMAWAIWCAVALWAMSSAWWVRTVAVVHPAMTAITVLATGNHYTFDVLTGALLVAVAYSLNDGLARAWSELRERRVPQQQPLRADVGSEVDLGLGLLRVTSHRHDPSHPERIVRHAIAGRQVEDRAQAGAGHPAAPDRLVGGDL
jgi:hypothetical protein